MGRAAQSSSTSTELSVRGPSSFHMQNPDSRAHPAFRAEAWSIGVLGYANQMGIASILTLKRAESEVLIVLPHTHASHVLLRDVGEMNC